MAPVGHREQQDPRNEPQSGFCQSNQGWRTSTGGELGRQSRGYHGGTASPGDTMLLDHDGQPGQRRLPRRLSDSLSAQPLRSAGLLSAYSIGLEPYRVQVSLPGPGDVKINCGPCV